jgi:hypothetical protein
VKRRNGETVKREETTASSEWFFWRAVLPHCRKISAHQEMRPPVTEFWAHREVRPPKLRMGRETERSGRARLLPSRKWQRVANGEWRMVKGMGQGTGGKGRGKRRNGETVKRRSGEFYAITHHALRFTHHESRITLHASRGEVTTYAIQTNCFRRHACP